MNVNQIGKSIDLEVPLATPGRSRLAGWSPSVGSTQPEPTEEIPGMELATNSEESNETEGADSGTFDKKKARQALKQGKKEAYEKSRQEKLANNAKIVPKEQKTKPNAPPSSLPVAAESKVSSSLPKKHPIDNTSELQEHHPERSNPLDKIFCHVRHNPLVTTDCSSTVGVSLYDSESYIHPMVHHLGVLLASGVVTNRSCLASLSVIRSFIIDYQAPQAIQIQHHLDKLLKAQIQFLVTCQPLVIGVGNAFRRLRVQLHAMDVNSSLDDIKSQLCAILDNFLHHRIVLALDTIGRLIANNLLSSVNEQTVILMDGSDPDVVSSVIDHAIDLSCNLHVVLVNSSTSINSTDHLRVTHTNLYSCAMLFNHHHFSYVILPSSACSSTGTILSSSSSLSLSHLANHFHVPVIVACETFKFTSKILSATGALNEYELNDCFQFKYDVIPASLVAAIVTEIGQIPTTSVNAVLREEDKNE